MLTPFVAGWVAAPIDRLMVACHPDYPVIVRGAVLVPPGEPDADPAGRELVQRLGPVAPRNLRDAGVLRLLARQIGDLHVRVGASNVRLCHAGVGIRRLCATDREKEGQCYRSSQAEGTHTGTLACGPSLVSG
jgi:hypothetical protein